MQSSPSLLSPLLFSSTQLYFHFMKKSYLTNKNFPSFSLPHAKGTLCCHIFPYTGMNREGIKSKGRDSMGGNSPHHPPVYQVGKFPQLSLPWFSQNCVLHKAHSMTCYFPWLLREQPHPLYFSF